MPNAPKPPQFDERSAAGSDPQNAPSEQPDPAQDAEGESAHGPVTMFALASHVLGRDATNGQDYEDVGLPFFAGCQVCAAGLGPAQACPSRNGFVRCRECIGRIGWTDLDECRRAVLGPHRYEVRVGDGNMGTHVIETIEAKNIDSAVDHARRYCIAGLDYEEDGDDGSASLVAYTDERGNPAINGGAHHVIEVFLIEEMRKIVEITAGNKHAVDVFAVEQSLDSGLYHVVVNGKRSLTWFYTASDALKEMAEEMKEKDHDQYDV